jgi:hypothetical protein
MVCPAAGLFAATLLRGLYGPVGPPRANENGETQQGSRGRSPCGGSLRGLPSNHLLSWGGGAAARERCEAKVATAFSGLSFMEYMPWRDHEPMKCGEGLPGSIERTCEACSEHRRRKVQKLTGGMGVPPRFLSFWWGRSSAERCAATRRVPGAHHFMGVRHGRAGPPPRDEN